MRIKIALLALVAGCTATTSKPYDSMLGELRRDDRSRADSSAAITAIDRASTLDRQTLIRAALAANRDLAAIREGWRAAVAAIPAVGAFDDPMVSYELAPLSIGSSSVPFGQRISVRQKLPFPGKRGLASDAAIANAKVMWGDVRAAQLVVAELASQLYDDAYLDDRAHEINDQHRVLVEQMKKVAEARIASGRGSTQDALQAEVELGRLETERAMLDAERVTIVARINGLLHRDPLAAVPSPPAELAVPEAPAALAALEQAALAARPQRLAANARVEAGEADVKGKQRAYYPDFELMASYDSMWDMTAHRWMVGVAVDVPIQRGRRAAEVDAARARVAQARATVESTIDDIRVEVARARVELVAALHVATLYDERLLPAARAEVDAAISGFTTGQNDFPAVILAERGLREIQLGTLRARTDAWHRQAALDRAVGRAAGGAR